MARRSGFVAAIVRARREEEHREAAVARAESQAVRALEQAQKAYSRAQKDQERERARLYAESRAAEAALKSQQLDDRVVELEGLLCHTLGVDDYFDLDTLRQELVVPTFEAQGLDQPQAAPQLETYLPRAPSFLAKLWPGTVARYEHNIAAESLRYEADQRAHDGCEASRVQALSAARAQYHQQVLAAEDEHAAQNTALDQLKVEFVAGHPEAVAEYFLYVLESSSYPESFPNHNKIAKALYGSVIAQTTLRTLHELFEADRTAHLESIVLNGYVEAIDPGRGITARTCVVTVRTTRDTFVRLNLRQVEPLACLRTLNAGVSRSPAELAPVRPVLEFSMVDPRFVEEATCCRHWTSGRISWNCRRVTLSH
jgi:restriction system protein